MTSTKFWDCLTLSPSPSAKLILFVSTFGAFCDPSPLCADVIDGSPLRSLTRPTDCPPTERRIESHFRVVSRSFLLPSFGRNTRTRRPFRPFLFSLFISSGFLKFKGGIGPRGVAREKGNKTSGETEFCLLFCRLPEMSFCMNENSLTHASLPH